MLLSFAAFIMTYERPGILKATIESLLEQSYPPQKILVVDNSESFETQQLVEAYKCPDIVYLRMGYNSGPAGAAKVGLETLAAEGFQWIYWGDDDNPPDFPDSIEQLVRIIHQSGRKLGIVGAVGQYFSTLKGEVHRVPDAVLNKTSSLDVDSIAGGQCMIVNSDLVRAGILPNDKLFFGFEELDFCLKAKLGGYNLVVSSELFLRARLKYGRIGFKRPAYSLKPIHDLKRQYYSTRNLLYIVKANKLYFAFAYQLVKACIKSVYGFRYGFNYGKINFVMLSKGLLHVMTGKLGG